MLLFQRIIVIYNKYGFVIIQLYFLIKIANSQGMRFCYTGTRTQKLVHNIVQHLVDLID